MQTPCEQKLGSSWEGIHGAFMVLFNGHSWAFMGIHGHSWPFAGLAPTTPSMGRQCLDFVFPHGLLVIIGCQGSPGWLVGGLQTLTGSRPSKVQI